MDSIYVSPEKMEEKFSSKKGLYDMMRYDSEYHCLLIYYSEALFTVLHQN